MYVFVSANILISSRGDYSRAASISFRTCSGAATIRERRLFESGVYLVIYGYASVGNKRGPRINHCHNCQYFTSVALGRREGVGVVFWAVRHQHTPSKLQCELMVLHRGGGGGGRKGGRREGNI